MKAKSTEQRKKELATLKNGVAGDLKTYGRKLTKRQIEAASITELLEMLQEEELKYIARQIYE